VGVARRAQLRERALVLLVQRDAERADLPAELRVEPRRLLAQRLAEDVEVAHGADRGREPGEVAVRRGGEACGQEGGEEAERRAQPAGGNPQLVHRLDLAGPRSWLDAHEGAQMKADDDPGGEGCAVV